MVCQFQIIKEEVQFWVAGSKMGHIHWKTMNPMLCQQQKLCGCWCKSFAVFTPMISFIWANIPAPWQFLPDIPPID